MNNYSKAAANYEASASKLWDAFNKDEPESLIDFIPDPPEPDVDDYASDLAARDYESRLFRDPKE